MGNFQTSENKVKKESQEIKEIKEIKENNVDKINEEDIFLKMYDISKKLLIEYNNEFLNENFCNNLALIYQKNISKFHIDLLKNLHDNISSNRVDEKLSLTIQYINKESDRFNVDIFKEDLKDIFWNEKFKLNNDTLLNYNLKNENIINSKISYNYIDQKHVNKILNLINKINIEFRDTKNEQDLSPKIGGNKIKNNKATNFLRKIQNTNKSIILSRYNIIENKKKVNKPDFNEIDINNEQKVNKLQDNNSKSNKSDFNEIDINNEQKVNKLQDNNSKSNKSENSKSNKLEANKPEANKPEANKPEANKPETNKPEANKPEANKPEANKPEANKSIKYIVPNSYQKPKSYCKNTEKCLLSKKELCQAITENFIVRNNIIAAILTTIPYKNNNEYEGGICFQMFMNLNSCKVCVPEDYKDLHKKDIKDILNGILDKSGYLTKSECREKKGYYLELSNEEKEILKSKVKKLNINDIKKEKSDELPDNNYNTSYVRFTEKIKKIYFEKINLLLIILEKIKDLPIINNTTLNLISEETKKIIDEMYNMCYYCYIYGIISLLKVDLSKKNIIEDKVYRYVSAALNKN